MLAIRKLMRSLAYHAYQEELDMMWNYHQRLLLEQKEKHQDVIADIVADYAKEIHALHGKIEQLEYRLEKCSPQ